MALPISFLLNSLHTRQSMDERWIISNRIHISERSNTLYTPPALTKNGTETVPPWASLFHNFKIRHKVRIDSCLIDVIERIVLLENPGARAGPNAGLCFRIHRTVHES